MLFSTVLYGLVRLYPDVKHVMLVLERTDKMISVAGRQVCCQFVSRFCFHILSRYCLL